jgi:hypothetical protein
VPLGVELLAHGIVRLDPRAFDRRPQVAVDEQHPVGEPGAVSVTGLGRLGIDLRGA